MKILLGITGSVAATLGGKLCKSLKEVGELQVVATESALKIQESTTVENSFLTGNYVYSDHHEWKWEKKGDPVLHIVLRDWFDVFVIAPLSANTLAKMAHGMCDNLLTTIWMASPPSIHKRIIVAPAMNTQMWKHPLVQTNIQILKHLGVTVINPIEKELACGEVGIGAMARIEDIVASIKNGS